MYETSTLSDPLPSGCKHDAIDTGMRVSWCKKCEVRLQWKDMQWVAVPRDTSDIDELFDDSATYWPLQWGLFAAVKPPGRLIVLHNNATRPVYLGRKGTAQKQGMSLAPGERLVAPRDSTLDTGWEECVFSDGTNAEPYLLQTWSS